MVKGKGLESKALERAEKTAAREQGRAVEGEMPARKAKSSCPFLPVSFLTSETK